MPARRGQYNSRIKTMKFNSTDVSKIDTTERIKLESEYNEYLIYEYIYHIINMLAHKMKFFDHADDYDHFALYLASIIYMRLINRKKPRIKSILNYIKRVIGVRKITFQEQFLLPSTLKDTKVYSFDNYALMNYLVDESSLYDSTAFNDIVYSLEDIVYIYLQKIPFKRDSVEWYNIYISVILTLLNSITPTDLQMKKIKEALPKNKDEVIDKIYKELRNAPAILYHLDNSMQPYIKALAVEIKHAISAEMSRECKYFISPDNTLKNLLINTYTESDPNEY